MSIVATNATSAPAHDVTSAREFRRPCL